MSRWLLRILNLVVILVILAMIPVGIKAYEPTDHNNKAVLALRNKEYDRAIELLNKAIKSRPDNTLFRQNLMLAYNSKALALEREGKDMDALPWYEKALAMDGRNSVILRNYVSSLNNLAVAQSNQKNFPESQKLFERASEQLSKVDEVKVRQEIRHNYSALLTLWGAELMKRNQVTEARGAFSQSLELDANNAVANIYLGDLYYEINEYDQARKYYSAALPYDKENEGYLKNRLQMIEDESKVEMLFKTSQDKNGWFHIQYVEYQNGTSVPQMLEMLTEARERIGKDLGIYPARAVSVKIYKGEDFYKISKLPEWAIGIFDGKMRLKVEDVQSAPSQVKDLLFHEYTHAVLAMNVKQKVPAWFHEGLAQLMEPQFKDNPREQAQMRDALATRKLDFAALKDSFRDIETKGDAEAAYLLSKYFLLHLDRKFGHPKLVEWIRHMANEVTFEESFEKVFGITLSKAQDAWIRSQVRE